MPVYNGAETIAACLDALLVQTVDAASYQVIVVDDGSVDDTPQIVARYPVTFIRQEHVGPGAARNRGAQLALGDLLLFTDADCEPLPDWIEQMRVPFADPTIAGAKGVYRTRQRSLVARFVQAEHEEKYDRLAREGEIDFVDTYAAAYRRFVFLAFGGFNTRFLRNQDQEFSFRLAEAGHKMVFVPQAAVYHRHVTTVRRYAWRKVRTGRWKVRVHALHPSKAIRDSYTPWSQKLQIVLLPLILISLVAAFAGLLPWFLPLTLVLAGFLSVIPLMRKAVRQGWSVVLITPLLAMVRAAALDLGLLWGIGDQVRSAIRRRLGKEHA